MINAAEKTAGNRIHDDKHFCIPYKSITGGGSASGLAINLRTRKAGKLIICNTFLLRLPLSSALVALSKKCPLKAHKLKKA
jgi:hypothetical protein